MPMRPGAKRVWRIVRASLPYAIGAGVGLTAVQESRAQSEIDLPPMDCPNRIAGWGAGWVFGHLWNSTDWNRTGYPGDNLNVATYDADGDFIDATGRWKWLNAKATMRCAYTVVVPGHLVLETFTGWGYGGIVVPHAEEVSEVTNTPTQDGGSVEDNTIWYICWYWLYPDGSRSAYYRCDEL